MFVCAHFTHFRNLAAIFIYVIRSVFVFQSDMRIIADFLAEGKDYFSDRKIVHKAALIKMIKVLSGDTDIGEVEKWMREQGVREEDEVKVCELFDQYERRGRKEGEKLGIAKGEKLGIAKGETRFVSLTSILLSSQRLDDLNKAVSDEKFRNSLYQEFAL